MAAKIDPRLRDLLKAVPSKFVREACGNRQVAHVQRMTKRWGVPLSGAKVDLYGVLGWLWTFLVRHGPTLKAVLDASDAEADGPLAVQLIKARIAKLSADARMAELRVAQKENHLCDRASVHEVFERLVNVVRKASDRAQARWGQEGFDFIVGLIDGFEDEIRVVQDGIAEPQSADAAT